MNPCSSISSGILNLIPLFRIFFVCLIRIIDNTTAEKIITRFIRIKPAEAFTIACEGLSGLLYTVIISPGFSLPDSFTPNPVVCKEYSVPSTS